MWGKQTDEIKAYKRTASVQTKRVLFLFWMMIRCWFNLSNANFIQYVSFHFKYIYDLANCKTYLTNERMIYSSRNGYQSARDPILEMKSKFSLLARSMTVQRFSLQQPLTWFIADFKRLVPALKTQFDCQLIALRVATNTCQLAADDPSKILFRQNI